MLGYGLYDEDKEYAYQTLVDNVGLLTPEILNKLNQIIVEGGHALVKKDDAALRGRCDSFVVETDVHFPTDINLLWDAMRNAQGKKGRKARADVQQNILFTHQTSAVVSHI